MDRTAFFDRVRPALFNGQLRQGQVDGLTAMLDWWRAHRPAGDRRWLAYALATAHHETGRSFGPTAELGHGRGKPYGRPDPLPDGPVYYGRGLVQLTWRRNYVRMGERLGLDLAGDPDLALRLEHALPILFTGMIEGLFTGRRLAQHFGPDGEGVDRADWLGARRIINGRDRASLVAGYGRAYLAALKAAGG